MALSKWCLIDYRKTAHWWVGREGTACGLDFRRNIQPAYYDEPRCRKCLAVLGKGD